ncbi:hypothetical protein [Cellulosimicrobium cellulans]|uniref:hypothetical protein n=1 Tax=Cellulosimicrobium cellulans TaxID=1710 RepID=UPI0020984132|nr:hypothetical protein [Cellulosimicrobium cellulans]MCO7273338.1 hypothetical protein [Cellulosimicrobium cellulans]
MGDLRAEEARAAAHIEAALDGVTVEQHDDGSESSMYDLNLVRDGTVFGACEVTAAADRRAIETWNVANGDGKRWIVDGLDGGWMLSLDPRCKIRTLQREAPGLLRRLEANPNDVAAAQVLRSLGVVDAHQGGTNFPGSIYLTVERGIEFTGGIVADDGNGLVRWFDEWIREPQQAHNIAKLTRSGLPEKHMFVIVPGFASGPFSATDLLMRADPPLPTVLPDLPDGLTHVWLTSTWTAGSIYHCGPSGWVLNDKAVA